MTKAILPNRPPPSLSVLAVILRKEQESIARAYHQRKLEEIVAPFDSRIQFRTKSERRGGSYITNIAPTDEHAGFNAADDSVTSRELFQWLDEGTAERWVGMPEDFINETSPSSLNTQSSSYDREEIFFLSEPTVGIDARNFLTKVDLLYQNSYRLQMNQAIETHLNGL